MAYVLSESDRNKFADVVAANIGRRRLNAVPQRRRRTPPAGSVGSSLTYVAITETITGATWDGTTKTDQDDLTVYPFSSTGEISIDRTRIITVGGPLETPITISTSKFKVGIVEGDDLLIVFCAEWDLPAGWES